MSKTDILSIKLDPPETVPTTPLTESNIDYKTEEPAIQMINDGYSLIHYLKQKDCWDSQDNLEDNQETHSIYLLCKIYQVIFSSFYLKIKNLKLNLNIFEINFSRMTQKQK